MQSIKCVVIGDTKIGKTCMLSTYSYNYYPGDNASNVFADIFSSTIDIGCGKQIKLSIWDTAEQEDHFNDYLNPNTDVILICFSVMNSKSFRNVKLKWYPEVRKFCPSAKIILVGNKIDMRNDEAAINKLQSIIISNEKPVTYCEGLEMAQKINALQYLECSALTRVGLAEVFDAVVKSVLFSSQIEGKNIRGVKRLCGESKAEDSDLSPNESKVQKSEDNLVALAK